MERSARWWARVGLVAVLAGMAPGIGGAGIVGSKHDLSGSAFSGGEICVICHVPHKAKTTVSNAPLWNHKVTETTFAVYSTPTMEATVGQPGGVSKLCLSCHDGTVALDAFGERSGGDSRVTAASRLGTDLKDDHPISITYNAALATADPGLYDPASRTVTIGAGEWTKAGTIADVLLVDGKLECSSCHAVHNDFIQDDDDPLLKITKAGSELCLACHKK